MVKLRPKGDWYYPGKGSQRQRGWMRVQKQTALVHSGIGHWLRKVEGGWQGAKGQVREQADRAKKQHFVLGAAGSKRQVDILWNGFPSSKCQGSVLAEWLGRMVGVGQMVSGRIFFPSPEVGFFSLKWAAGKSPDLPWAASPSTEQQAAGPWSWAELCPCHPHSGPPRNCGCDLICTCSLHWCAQVKMSSHWSRVDPNPITSVLKKKREIWIQAHTHTQGKAMWRGTQRPRCCCYKSRNAKGCQQPPEDKGEACNKFFSVAFSESMILTIPQFWTSSL